MRPRHISCSRARDHGFAAGSADLFLRHPDGVGHADRRSAGSRAQLHLRSRRPRCASTKSDTEPASRNPKRFPNVVRLSLGETTKSLRWLGDIVVVMETAVDDLNPQVLGDFTERALQAGALDVMCSSVHMKKNRLATLVTILCDRAHVEPLQQLLFRETSTLGVRIREERRACLDRKFVPVQTPWGEIRIKIGLLNGVEVNAAPEYEDCRRCAEEHSVPLKLVMQSALAIYQNRAAPITQEERTIMDQDTLLRLLEDVQKGLLSPETASAKLARLPFEDIGFAKLDHHRPLRTGLPEVILASGKTPQQVAEIFERMAASGVDVLATRADATTFDAVQQRVAARHSIFPCLV